MGQHAARFPSRAVTAMMGIATSPALADEVLAPVAAAVRADSAVYLRFRQDAFGRPRVSDCSYLGQHPNSLQQYVAHYFAQDPVLRPLLEGPERWRDLRRPLHFHLREQVEPRDLEGSAYFRDFLKPYDLGDILAVAFPFDCDGPEMLCVGLHRSARRAPFGARAVAAFEDMERPLALMLESLCLRAVVREQSSLIAALDGDSSGLGFVVLDAAMNPMRGSRDMLSLLSCRGAATERARDALAQGRARLGESGGATVQVRLSAELDGELRRVAGASCCHFVLLTRAASQSDRADPEAFLDALTPRERQVVGELPRQSSNARIAAALGISIRTVENHLRSVYDKLGVNSRTQLLSLVLNCRVGRWQRVRGAP